MKLKKPSNMNFIFLIISLVLVSGFVGSVFAQQQLVEKEYTLENYGINLIEDQNRTVVDTIQWNGLAKKNGMEMGDIISELKIENLNRPNKGLVYPFSLGLLLIFGYLNYRNYGFKKN